MTVLFMVIENFKPGAREAVYRRYSQRGRMLPAGLDYLSSWVEQGGDRCFQLMQTDDPGLFDAWTECWRDLVDFEVVPVTVSPTRED